MKYALIGCGRVSPNHVQAAINNNLEIVGICDVKPEATKSLAGKCSLDKVREYTDHLSMLEKEHPDIVAIATGSGTHASIALDCINMGCNVIIEKPIALSVADANAIICSGREKGVKICVCHQNRFNRSIQYIRKAIEGGRFGRMLHGTASVRWNRGKEYYDQAPWRGTWTQDGGCLMNQCIHSIDLLRWMLGDEVEEVMAYTDRLLHPYIEAEDFGMAMLKFKNGAYGLIEGSVNVYPGNPEETLCLFGERGTVKAGGKSVNVIDEWEFADGLDDATNVKTTYAENPPDVYGFGHTPLYTDFVDSIFNGRQPYVDGETGKRAMELVLAIYRSAAEGKAVRLPLKEGSTTDYVGRFS